MDTNKLSEWNWKKIAIGIGAIMILAFSLREIAFWSFFHEFKKSFLELQHTVDNEITQGQRDAEKTRKEMDAYSNNFDDYVQKRLKQDDDFFKKSEHEMEKRDKAMTKAFNEMPKQMMQQQEKFRQEMKQHFFDNTQSKDRHFIKESKNSNNN